MEKPKAPRCTCYHVFQKQAYKYILDKNPSATFADISKKTSQMWLEVSEKDKRKYRAAAKKINESRKEVLGAVKDEPLVPVPTPQSKELSALAAPFPVTLIRVDRKPQPMTYQLADKTDMLSVCKAGAKSSVKVVYTCTPVNPQAKGMTSPVKKEQDALNNAQLKSSTPAGVPVTTKNEEGCENILHQIHPDPSLVKVEPLDQDDVVVIENVTPRSRASDKNAKQKVSPASSSLLCTSPVISTSPPVLQSVLPKPLAPKRRSSDTPPVLTVEPSCLPSKSPANSATASAILKQKLATFVASKRSFTDVNDHMPTKLTIQGKTIVSSGPNSCQPPKTSPKKTWGYAKQEDNKEKNSICSLTTNSQPPVRVAFKPKKKDGEKKKKDGEEVPIYTCNQCMIAFSQDSQLKAHFLSAHTEEEGICPPFKCHFCNVVFPQKTDLTSHMVEKHANNGVVSLHRPVPKQTIQAEVAARAPITSQNVVVTQLYPKSDLVELQDVQPSSTAVSAVTHQQQPIATGSTDSQQVTADQRPVSSPLNASNAESCNLCGCLFPYKRSLDIHRLKEHVHIFNPTVSVSLDRSETVNLEVEGALGSTIQQNVVHKTSFCLSCGYPCKSNSELGKHIYSKHGGKYFCPATGCTRVYHERRCLKLHLNSHHPKFKAYSCKSCSFCTYQQLAILRHLDGHVNKLETNVLYVEKETVDSDSSDEPEVVEASDSMKDKDKVPSDGDAESIDDGVAVTKAGESIPVDDETPSSPYVYIERFNGEEVEDVPFTSPAEKSPSPPPPKPKPKPVPKPSSKTGKPPGLKSLGGVRCLDCKVLFPDRGSLTAHFSTCGSNVPAKKKQKLSAPPTVPADALTLTCNLCFQHFKTFIALKSHRRHQHFNHQDSKSFSCFTCGRNFPNRRGLSAHMRQHLK